MEKRSWSYLSGALAGAVFFAATLLLATMVEGYSHVSQTVSEIGAIGSPAEEEWRLATLAVALALGFFAYGLFRFARDNQASILPAVFMASFALAEAGMAFFPAPHSLHNIFGLSMTIGYMTPLVLALSWSRLPNASTMTRFSLIAFGLVIAAIFLNLSPLFARDLYPLEYYGLVQRTLFVAFFGWCFYLSLKLYAYDREAAAWQH